jgi:hypothetical protein
MVSRLDVTLVTAVLQFAVRGGATHATMTRRPSFLRADSPEFRMSQIEYKTILLPYKTGIFQSDSLEVAEMLNKEGVERWHLSQIVLPSTAWGRANTMVAILQRNKK